MVQYKYEWGSTHIMLQAFDTLYHVDMELLGWVIFFGSRALGNNETSFQRSDQSPSSLVDLFLETAFSTFEMKPKVDHDFFYTIPHMKQSGFYYRRQIEAGSYNVVCSPNYEAIDSLCPARGELF